MIAKECTKHSLLVFMYEGRLCFACHKSRKTEPENEFKHMLTLAQKIKEQDVYKVRHGLYKAHTNSPPTTSFQLYFTK